MIHNFKNRPGRVGTFNRSMFPVIANLSSTSLIEALIPVQPMLSEPSGKIFSLDSITQDAEIPLEDRIIDEGEEI